MTQNNIKIAVTGGIGSGKSTVLAYIGECGFPVCSCDDIYNDLLKNDRELVARLAERFGMDILTDGSVNKRVLAGKVFCNKDEMKALCEITHPVIFERAFSYFKGKSLGFCEVPLLFEYGYEKLFDGVIVVLREKESRLRSVVERNKIDKDEVTLRVNNQISYDISDFAKYYVIHNDGNLDDLRQKTQEILENISEKYL